MIISLFIIPALAGSASFFIRDDSIRRKLMLLTAGLHLLLSFFFIARGESTAFSGWLHLDVLGKLFLSTTSILFFAVTVYAVDFLKGEVKTHKKDFTDKFIFDNTTEAVFSGCFLFFLATMSLVVIAGHLGLLWIAMEATTLATAPLIYFHRHHRSLEATWKYLLICSVGIALALLGTLFLAVAYLHSGQQELTLLTKDLIESHQHPNTLWLKAAFLFLLVGYGTKMGLAPLHTWLPDAHSEAPAFVSALLSGALLNCALLSLLRVQQVCVAAGLGVFTRELFLLFGLLSMGVGALFIVRQKDYKRMLAYSSIEHMGIISVGIGLGGLGTYGALLHMVNHSFCKGALFLTAGNILARYKSKAVSDVHGLIRSLPASGGLWFMGFVAITGSPPAGTFMSELLILRTALQQGQFMILIMMLIVILWIFVSMAATFIEMTFGEEKKSASSESVAFSDREGRWRLWPNALLLLFVLILGIFIPTGLANTIQQIVLVLEVR